MNARALQRRFADDVGYGPKVLQRVLRRLAGLSPRRLTHWEH